MLRRGSIAVVLSLVWAGLALASISFDYDESASFADYRTYAWKDGTPARHSGVEQAIVEAVDHELAAKGLRRVDEDPDLFVATYALADEQRLRDLEDSVYWNFVTGVTEIGPSDVRAGTLVIDLVDSASDKVVWRGLSSGSVKGVPNKISNRVGKVVRRILRDYPPGPRGGR